MKRGTSAHRIAVLLLTGASTLCILWNLRDEMYIMGSWNDFLINTLIWITVPYVTSGLVFIAKKPQAQRVGLGAIIVQLLWFLSYAINGSTQGKMGAEHMHIVLAPVLLIPITLVAAYFIFTLDRAMVWLQTRTNVTAD